MLSCTVQSYLVWAMTEKGQPEGNAFIWWLMKDDLTYTLYTEYTCGTTTVCCNWLVIGIFMVTK